MTYAERLRIPTSTSRTAWRAISSSKIQTPGSHFSSPGVQLEPVQTEMPIVQRAGPWLINTVTSGQHQPYAHDRQRLSRPSPDRLTTGGNCEYSLLSAPYRGSAVYSCHHPTFSPSNSLPAPAQPPLPQHPPTGDVPMPLLPDHPRSSPPAPANPKSLTPTIHRPSPAHYTRFP